jgi:hypothetical protein
MNVIGSEHYNNNDILNYAFCCDANFMHTYFTSPRMSAERHLGNTALDH